MPHNLVAVPLLLSEEVQLQARAARRQAGARRREEERPRAAQGPRRQPRFRPTQEDHPLREQGGPHHVLVLTESLSRFLFRLS